jgi:hypothetical protein
MATQSRTIIPAAGKTIDRTDAMAARGSAGLSMHKKKAGHEALPANPCVFFSLELGIPADQNLPKLGPGQLPVHFAYGAIVRKMPQAVTQFFGRLVFCRMDRY